MDVFSTELGIWLSFIKTLDFRVGVLNPPPPPPWYTTEFYVVLYLLVIPESIAGYMTTGYRTCPKHTPF
jgi:hypothetical protein